MQDSGTLPSTSLPAAKNSIDSCCCKFSSEPDGSARSDVSSDSCHKAAAPHTATHCRRDCELARPLVVGDSGMESVFEPRPPHPLSSPQPSSRGGTVRCALAHDETVTVLDPWRRRPSSLDHGRHKSHCTRPTVSCNNKTKSGSRRRRSCGNHLPRRVPLELPDIGPPVSRSSERAASCAPADSLDLVISSDILESMLQGAEGYCATSEPASVDRDGSTKDDSDSVFL